MPATPARGFQRRQRLAASASLPFDQPLEQARRAMECALRLLDTVGTPTHGTDDPRATVKGARQHVDEALRHCEQLSRQAQHLQQLLAQPDLIPHRFDLPGAVAQALCSARLLLPPGVLMVNRLGPLQPVLGDRAEIVQALVDCLVQCGHHLGAAGQLVLGADMAGDAHGMVRLDILALGEPANEGFALALESAIDTLAHHQGSLTVSRQGWHGLLMRIRLRTGP